MFFACLYTPMLMSKSLDSHRKLLLHYSKFWWTVFEISSDLNMIVLSNFLNYFKYDTPHYLKQSLPTLVKLTILVCKWNRKHIKHTISQLTRYAFSFALLYCKHELLTHTQMCWLRSYKHHMHTLASSSLPLWLKIWRISWVNPIFFRVVHITVNL